MSTTVSLIYQNENDMRKINFTTGTIKAIKVCGEDLFEVELFNAAGQRVYKGMIEASEEKRLMKKSADLFTRI